MLLAVLGCVVLIEATVYVMRDRFMDEVPLMYEKKLERATTGPAEDVLVLGDSQAAVAIRPRALEDLLPPVRLFNYAMLGAGPSSGEMVLERYLENHEPPKLIVMLYALPALIQAEGWIAESRIFRHLYGPREVIRAVSRLGEYGYLLEWLATRLPSLRFRDGLKSGLISGFLSAAPGYRPAVREWMGISAHPTDVFRFSWDYTDRWERNRRVVENVELDRGWYYWRERAMRNERLPDKARFQVPPFNLSRSETLALEHVFEICQEAGIPLLVVPAPIPQGMMDGMAKVGDDRKLEALWNGLLARFPLAEAPHGVVRPLPHRYFADPIHLNPAGTAYYTDFVAPVLTGKILEVARP